MASTDESGERGEQAVPGGEKEEEKETSIQGIQSRYLRCSSPR